MSTPRLNLDGTFRSSTGTIPKQTPWPAKGDNFVQVPAGYVAISPRTIVYDGQRFLIARIVESDDGDSTLWDERWELADDD